MTKPTWTHTHNGENNEELCCCEGKYYTRFAWDNFAAAYTGRVRPAHRDRPPFVYNEIDFSMVMPTHKPDPGDITISNLWADDEITLELP